jgi:hypothetical protein
MEGYLNLRGKASTNQPLELVGFCSVNLKDQVMAVKSLVL